MPVLPSLQGLVSSGLPRLTGRQDVHPWQDGESGGKGGLLVRQVRSQRSNLVRKKGSAEKMT